jgi:multidrug efflux pump
MVGGLIVSQILTIFTTPVVYLYFDRLAQRISPRPVRAPRPTPSPLVPGPLASPASR